MNEQSKARARRLLNPMFADRWFVGKGIDIGCGGDPLSAKDFPRIEEVVPWDLPQGDAQYMAGVPDDWFDFAHSSHCLEHMKDPMVAIGNWLRIIRPGGFLTILVPDELLYEQARWPSRFNSDHKRSFSLRRTQAISSSIPLLNVLWRINADVERLELLSTGWDPSGLGRDQTLGPCECAIEFVLRKPGKLMF